MTRQPPPKRSAPAYEVECSADGNPVWEHSAEASTVGRFSRRFGMDVHTTVTAQLQGAGQCLHCTHAPAGKAEWLQLCTLRLCCTNPKWEELTPAPGAATPWPPQAPLSGAPVA